MADEAAVADEGTVATVAAAADEAAIWGRAREGDPHAFTALYDRHRDRVFRQALRSTPGVHDAEDVTALVFLEAWRRRKAVRVVDGSILPWLLVTTNFVSANAARAARRHHRVMAKVAAPDPIDDHADAVLDQVDSVRRGDALRTAFGRLSKREQDVLTLCVVNEFSLAQAAETLGVPVGTVKSRLARAKARLATLTGQPLSHQAPADGENSPAEAASTIGEAK